MLFTINFYQYLQLPILLSQSIILPMNKALNKSENIQKTAEAYKNNPNLNIRRATTIHNITPNSVSNYLNSRTKPAPDYFTSYQKLSLIEESVLVEHIIRGYHSGYLLTIPHLNNYANKLLRIKDISDTINVHLHNSLFKRYPEI